MDGHCECGLEGKGTVGRGYVNLGCVEANFVRSFLPYEENG